MYLYVHEINQSDDEVSSLKCVQRILGHPVGSPQQVCNYLFIFSYFLAFHVFMAILYPMS